MTSNELGAWLDTCPTHKWVVVDIEGDYMRVIFPFDDPNEMTPVERRDFYDRNGNMTLLDLSCETGLTVPELKKILMEDES